MKKTVSEIMLALLLTSVSALALNLQLVNASGTTYIRADGSIDPPTAPITTTDNVTYTLVGNISSDACAIIVERDNIIIDGAGYTLQSTGGGTGIVLSERNNVTIKDMEIIAFYYGVGLSSSSDCIVSGNNITNNFYVGIALSSSLNNVISGNNVANNINRGISLVSSSSNMVIENNMLSNGGYGCVCFESSSDNNVISGNNITGSSNHGVYLGFSSNNTVSGNNITNNNNDGVNIYHSSNSMVSENNIIHNGGLGGIYLGFSSNNTVSGNNITNYRDFCVWLYCSTNNVVRGNRISRNAYGVMLTYSGGNSIYHNDFIRSRACSETPSENVWDNGYPSGGNYWSDYTDADLYSGPFQNETGGDGIWDHPYIIDANNRDNYPLVRPWTPVIGAAVDIIPNVLNLRSNARYITAFIELPSSYNVMDIDVPSILMNHTIPVDSSAPAVIGDYDSDGIPDLMVKLNRTAVLEFILSKGIKYGNVTLTISGIAYDGIMFEGSDIVRVKMLGDVNADGKVDVKDVSAAGLAYGSYLWHSRWNPDADENEDGKIDARDLSLVARNFGKSYK